MTFQLRKLLPLVALACLGTAAHADVITFETGFVGASTGPVFFTADYEGFRFGTNNSQTTDWFYTDDLSGTYLAQSPTHVIATDPLASTGDPFEASQGITRATDFSFVGAWFSGFDEIKYSLFDNGVLVCTSATGTAINTRTTTFVASCSGAAVDEVRVLGSQRFYTMDDFTYNNINNVPEPTSLALVGLAALIGFGATRRKVGAPAGSISAA